MKILILAQTPPPFHGQAIMQKYLVDANWDWCVKKHIRLSYSNEINEVGKFRYSKIYSLFKIILAVWRERLKGKIDLLYYPPAGPNRIPFYRDIITLFFIRCLSKKIVFHFHAGGINDLLKKLNPVERLLAKFSLKKPDASIVLLNSFREEIKWFNSEKIFTIPNGIQDVYPNFKNITNGETINLLTVGMISKEKGIFVILETAKLLKNNLRNIKWKIVGGFVSSELEDEYKKLVDQYEIGNMIEFTGEMKGDEKWENYSKTDIFVFLSTAGETVSLVLLEAMMFSLPVIGTNWRGIPEIIENGESGFLVPINDPNSTAEKIELLINNSSQRNEMGNRGRKIFLEKFTLDKHLNNIEQVFKEIVLTDE